MSKMWKMTVFAVAAVVAMSLSTGAFAGEKKTEGKKHGPACMGEIVSIDAKCVTVKTKDGEVAIAITSDTKFGGKDATKTVADFKAGDKVYVGYKEEDGKKVATRIGAPRSHEKK